MIALPPRPSASARLAAGAAAAAIVSLTAVLAQDRETLGTRVTAENNVIALRWERNHPWDKQLAAAGVELFAEYRSETRGLIAESLGRASGRGADREIQFTLPEDLRSIPNSEICLYLQPVGGKTVLPIRRANEQGTDTARFRYAAWEQGVRARAEARVAEARAVARRADTATAARRLADQEAVLAKRGWSGAQSCQNITVPRAAALPKPYDVVEPAQHDDTARRVCVRRIWYGREVTAGYLARLREEFAKPEAARDAATARRRLLTTYGDAFIVPEAAGPLLEQLRALAGDDDPVLRMRAAQAAEFLRDWKRLSPAIGSYDPHLGGREDVLPWPATVSAVALRVLGPSLAAALDAEWALAGEPAPTSRDVAGVVGAALDAYIGCVQDGVRQLAIKHTAWESLQAQMASGERERQLQEFLARECRQEVATRDALQTEHDALRADLLRLEDAQKQASASAPLPTRAQALNFATCGSR